MALKFEDLESKIFFREQYVLVNSTDVVDYYDIIRTLGKLFAMAEFHEKHIIWVFSEDRLNIGYPDLEKIKEFVITHHPSSFNADKAAIVAKTGLQRALAEMYASLRKELPRKIKVFSDLESAENWIAECPPYP
jgi:hypothetical protein